MLDDGDHLARILHLAKVAGTREADELFFAIRDDLKRRGDLPLWLRAVETAHDRGALEDDGAFFLVDTLTEWDVEEAVWDDPILLTIDAKLEAIERREGVSISETTWRIGEGPLDWERLNEEWDARFDAMFATRLSEFGYAAMAATIRSAAYELRSRLGSCELRPMFSGAEPFWREY